MPGEPVVKVQTKLNDADDVMILRLRDLEKTYARINKDLTIKFFQ